MHIKVKKQIKF